MPMLIEGREKYVTGDSHDGIEPYRKYYISLASGGHNSFVELFLLLFLMLKSFMIIF